MDSRKIRKSQNFCILRLPLEGLQGRLVQSVTQKEETFLKETHCPATLSKAEGESVSQSPITTLSQQAPASGAC